MTDTPAQLLPTIWIMRTADSWYPIQPSTLCKPGDHGSLNPHVLTIEDADGQTIWRRFQA